MDVHQTNNICTTLMAAVYSHQLDTVSLLLSRGARVRDVDTHGNTALHLAACPRSGDYDIRMVEILLAAGAPIEAINDNGDTPLLAFARAACLYELCVEAYGNETDVSPALIAILHQGANALAVDRSGKTARDIIADNLSQCHPHKGREMLAALDWKMIEQQTPATPTTYVRRRTL